MLGCSAALLRNGTARSTDPSAAEMMHLWRRQIGQRHQVSERRGPRPFAVFSYRVHGSDTSNGLVELSRLTLLALFDEQAPTGELATRLLAVGGIIQNDALRFGGLDLSRLDKDLRLPPVADGRGKRFDAHDSELFSFALALERYYERVARHPYIPRKRMPVLPMLPTSHGGRFVDVTRLPKRQVIPIVSPSRDLCGQFGTTVFDFHSSRFASQPSARR